MLSGITPLAQEACKPNVTSADLGENAPLCLRQAGVKLECRQGPGIVVSQGNKYRTVRKNVRIPPASFASETSYVTALVQTRGLTSTSLGPMPYARTYAQLSSHTKVEHEAASPCGCNGFLAVSSKWLPPSLSSVAGLPFGCSIIQSLCRLREMDWSSPETTSHHLHKHAICCHAVSVFSPSSLAGSHCSGSTAAGLSRGYLAV